MMMGKTKARAKLNFSSNGSEEFSDNDGGEDAKFDNAGSEDDKFDDGGKDDLSLNQIFRPSFPKTFSEGLATMTSIKRVRLSFPRTFGDLPE